MQRTRETTLIIPGVNGSGPGHWQDYWLHDNPEALLVDQKTGRARASRIGCIG